jgi:hypothetical protein
MSSGRVPRSLTSATTIAHELQMVPSWNATIGRSCTFNPQVRDARLHSGKPTIELNLLVQFKVVRLCVPSAQSGQAARSSIGQQSDIAPTPQSTMERPFSVSWHRPIYRPGDHCSVMNDAVGRANHQQSRPAPGNSIITPLMPPSHIRILLQPKRCPDGSMEPRWRRFHQHLVCASGTA